MASIPAVFLRFRRRAQRRRFDEVESDYREIFEAIERVEGEGAVDALAEWALAETEAGGSLPTPRRLREEARAVLANREADLPADSPLHP